jgi:lysophospholipase L1-like esterase
MSDILYNMRGAILIAAFLLLSGCGSDVFLALDGSYHAFGDSITVGQSLSDPATQRYSALIAAANRLSLSVYAIGGDQACDIPTRQIFPNADSPSLAQHALYSLLISTNDVDAKGEGAYEAVFNLCQQASIAWLALPLEDKVLATSSTVLITGASHVEGAPFHALVTDAAGASLRFPVTLTSAGPLYVWYRITDGNPCAFTYSIDNKVLSTIASSTSPSIATVNGTTSSLALLRIPAVAAGTHSLTLTQSTSAASGMGIVAVGVTPPAGQTSLPRVLVGTTPLQLAASTAVCGVTQIVCLAYSADITANVALFAGDGLNVQLFDSSKYMTGTSADMSDIVHPNALGHREIAHAIQDVYD